MCGRFVGAFNVSDLLEEFALPTRVGEVVFNISSSESLFVPNYNTAPTHEVPILRLSNQQIAIDVMQWGLVPAWSKDPKIGSTMINARSETITEKPSFRGLLAGHRCIVPMSGFYEWDRSDIKRKIPYYVNREDGRLMLVAGIWTTARGNDDRPTFSLITRESGDDLAHIHNRSPVQLTATDALDWMSNPRAPIELFVPDLHPRLHARQVSSLVNNVRNNNVSLLDKFDESPEQNEPDTLF